MQAGGEEGCEQGGLYGFHGYLVGWINRQGMGLRTGWQAGGLFFDLSNDSDHESETRPTRGKQLTTVIRTLSTFFDACHVT